MLLERDAFPDKFEIVSPVTSKGGMERTFLVIKKQFIILQ